MMKLLKPVVLALLFVGASADVRGADTIVALKDRAQAADHALRLRDVAVIHQAPDYRGPDLETVEIGPAPRPGETTVLTRPRLLMSLKAQGVSVEAVRLSGADETVIDRQTQTVSSDTIEARVREHILSHMSWNEEDVEIRRISGARDIRVPAGPIRFSVTPPRNTEYLGRISFRVALATPGGEERELWVAADICVYVSVLVARHPIARLREIGPADVRVEKRDLGSLSNDILTSLEQVAGKRTRTRIGTGEPIRSSQVEIPPAVRRGDLVTLKVENDLMRITARGKVLEDGRPGDTIRIMNIGSKKEVYGKVIDGSTARVDF